MKVKAKEASMPVTFLKLLKEILVRIGIDDCTCEYMHSGFGCLVYDIGNTPACTHLGIKDETIVLHTYIGTIYDDTMICSMADPELIVKLKERIDLLITKCKND